MYDSLREVGNLSAFSRVLEPLLVAQVQCESVEVDDLPLEGELIDELQDFGMWSSSNESPDRDTQESRYEIPEYLVVLNTRKTIQMQADGDWNPQAARNALIA